MFSVWDLNYHWNRRVPWLSDWKAKIGHQIVGWGLSTKWNYQVTGAFGLIEL